MGVGIQRDRDGGAHGDRITASTGAVFELVDGGIRRRAYRCRAGSPYGAPAPTLTPPMFGRPSLSLLSQVVLQSGSPGCCAQ